MVHHLTLVNVSRYENVFSIFNIVHNIHYYVFMVLISDFAIFTFYNIH